MKGCVAADCYSQLDSSPCCPGGARGGFPGTRAASWSMDRRRQTGRQGGEAGIVWAEAWPLFLEGGDGGGTGGHLVLVLFFRPRPSGSL